MTTQERREEALSRATNVLGSFTNYPAIFQGFGAMGIPESDIRPRENVFTFEAWKALGRHVRKGQHGVRVITYITTDDRKPTPQTEEQQTADGAPAPEPKKRGHHSRPWTTTVFHVSQTDLDAAPKAAESEVAA
jgi:antirestriction protein ArdC